MSKAPLFDGPKAGPAASIAQYDLKGPVDALEQRLVKYRTFSFPFLASLGRWNMFKFDLFNNGPRKMMHDEFVDKEFSATDKYLFARMATLTPAVDASRCMQIQYLPIPTAMLKQVIEEQLGYGHKLAKSGVYDALLKDDEIVDLKPLLPYVPELTAIWQMDREFVYRVNNPWQKIFALSRKNRSFFTGLTAKNTEFSQLDNWYQDVQKPSKICTVAQWEPDFTFKDILEHAQSLEIENQAKRLFDEYSADIARSNKAIPSNNRLDESWRNHP